MQSRKIIAAELKTTAASKTTTTVTSTTSATTQLMSWRVYALGIYTD